MSYHDKLQYFIIEDQLKNDWLNSHLIVFDIDNNDRRKIFFEYVSKTGWKEFEINIHTAGDDDYDFIIYDVAAFSPKSLYDILKKHNKKILIFDNDAVINKKGLMQIIEGGVCSSPDSGSKWPVRLEGKPEFIFRGVIIILTSHLMKDFMKKEKFSYLTRDCLKI